MTAYTSVGLFTASLDNFLADCSIATTYCNSSTYSSNYDGFAIGQLWYVDPRATLSAANAQWIKADHYIFTCFASNGGCTGLSSKYVSVSSYGHYLWTGFYTAANFTSRFP